MAKNEDKRKKNDEASRVYKAASVHKRHVDNRLAGGEGSQAKSAKSSGAPVKRPNAPAERAVVSTDGANAPAGGVDAPAGGVDAPANGANASASNTNASAANARASANDANAPAKRAGAPAKSAKSTQGESNEGKNSFGPKRVSAAFSSAVTAALPKAGRVFASNKPGSEAENAAEQALDEGSGAQVETSADAVSPEAAGEGGVEAAADEKGSADDGAEAESEDNAATEEEAEETADQHAKPKKRGWKLVVGVVFVVVVAALLVTVGFIGGNRWVRFDDAADMQGRWFVHGTDVPLRFENGSIVLNDETSYEYKINPTAKTIEYKFGNLAGQGRYWFNAERDVLVITDGADYTMWSTLLDDVSYELGRLFGKGDLPTTETSIVLSRSVVQAPVAPAPSDASASASAAGSESASSSEDSPKDSEDESRDNLKVSDIMMEEPSEASDGQNQGSDQYGTYRQ